MLIHHITHIANLPAIIREGGLVCDSDAEQRGLCEQSIAYDEIKERRKRRAVQTLTGQPVARGGVVAEYVPFYFANRSPMLYAIYSGSVPNFRGSEEDVVYLVSSVERVAAAGLAWCFTDGHAAEAVTQFSADAADLQRLDWNLIGHWSWKDTPADPDRKRRKQAEFLVHGSFPWALVERIAVMNAAAKERVEALLRDHAQPPIPSVTVEPKWYYTTTVTPR